MNIGTAFAVWAGAMCMIAALGARAAWARGGVVMAAALMPLPLIVDAEPMLCAALAFVLAVLFACAVDFAAGRKLDTFPARLVQAVALLALVDAHSAQRIAPRLDRSDVARLLVAALIGAAAFLSWIEWADHATTLRFIAWHIAAAVMVLAVAEAMSSGTRLATRSFGISVRAVHDEPWRSRTVGEFWSRRWNLFTSRWLADYCFKPLVRRSATFALLMTFAVSAAMHVYLILVPGEVAAWLSWAAFFMAQPFVILIERRLRVRHWPRAAGHAWTIGTLLLLSPLLFGPIRQLVDPSP